MFATGMKEGRARALPVPARRAMGVASAAPKALLHGNLTDAGDSTNFSVKFRYDYKRRSIQGSQHPSGMKRCKRAREVVSMKLEG